MKSSIISYGHDIEAAWLILESARITGDAELISWQIRSVELADAGAGQ